MQLTERQQQILTFIKDFVRDKGFPPTVREIGVAFNIKSPNGVVAHITALEKKGAISTDARRARTIRVLEDTDHRKTAQEIVEKLDEYNLFTGFPNKELATNIIHTILLKSPR